MTLEGGRADAGRREQGPEHTPRLRLKPKAPPTGHVDGAWWPRSDDLPNELPDLLAVLSVRLGAITRVVYNSAEWAKAPTILQTGGHEVQLEGSDLQPTSTVEVLGTDSKKILLVVVPHQFDPDIAHQAMMAAAAPNNASTVDDLLAVSAQERRARIRAAATERGWTTHD
jgi:Family of unknown function (DUF5994)